MAFPYSGCRSHNCLKHHRPWSVSPQTILDTSRWRPAWNGVACEDTGHGKARQARPWSVSPQTILEITPLIRAKPLAHTFVQDNGSRSGHIQGCNGPLKRNTYPLIGL